MRPHFPRWNLALFLLLMPLLLLLRLPSPRATAAPLEAGAPLAPPANIAFESVLLPGATGAQFTSLAIGPDGKLYGTTSTGDIWRWPLLADGTTGTAEVLTSLRQAEGDHRLLIGLAFDPQSTAKNLIAWISHTEFGFANMLDWRGKISRLSGPDLETVDDIVIGLPRSCRDHVTNGIAFGPDDALYILQGSNTSAGAPDPAWCDRPERLLTAAMLRLDASLITAPPLNVRTQGSDSYDPFATDAPLTLYATGLRNAYGMLWHSNGHLFVPVNGTGDGGNTPAGIPGAACSDGNPYDGQPIPGLENLDARRDYLAVIEAGGYYGHPNPLRCEFVLEGGNPTADRDDAEVRAYPVGTQPDPAFRGYTYKFGKHRSPNGIIEYHSPTFDGRMQGAILVTKFGSQPGIIGLKVAGDPPQVIRDETDVPGLAPLASPLALVESVPSGNLYVSEYLSARVVLLRPIDVATK